MRIHLIRHAEAEDVGPNVPSDFERLLTTRGFEQATALRDALLGAGIAFDYILTSPLLRARQTAEPLVQCLTETSESMLVLQELAPETFSPVGLKQILYELDGESIAMVGHMPTIAELADDFLGDVGVPLEFAKGAIMTIELTSWKTRQLGRLVSFVTPRWYATSR